MFKIDQETKEIQITRGDIGCVKVQALEEDEKTLYVFKVDDVVRLKVTEAGNCNNVVLEKDKIVEMEEDSVRIRLRREDTKIGDIIHKPVKYWYEVELNPDTEPQTIVGYDDDGPKIFTLYPEGADENEG